VKVKKTTQQLDNYYTPSTPRSGMAEAHATKAAEAASVIIHGLEYLQLRLAGNKPFHRFTVNRFAAGGTHPGLESRQTIPPR
jgi:hypothetical protein